MVKRKEWVGNWCRNRTSVLGKKLPIKMWCRMLKKIHILSRNEIQNPDDKSYRTTTNSSHIMKQRKQTENKIQGTRNSTETANATLRG